MKVLYFLSGFERAFGRALTIGMSPQCWSYNRALQREKTISPLMILRPEGPMATNDWYITYNVVFEWSKCTALALDADCLNLSYGVITDRTTPYEN